ncbi:MAG: DUF368 domain-containing protein [Microthrixaceae bacterium]
MLKRTSMQVVRGFFMGSADIVPGVSGGTIALVLGIYTHLIDTVRDGAAVLGAAAKGDFSGVVEKFKAVDWAFLLPLLVGIGLAIVALSHSIEHLLETQPVRMAATFFGLVVGSIVVTSRRLRLDPTRAATLAGVAVVAFFILGLRSGPVTDPVLPYVFLAGAIAICAMILPGISGSFLLLMLGMYDTVLGAVSDRDLVLVAVFGLGAVLGLAGFSTLLHWALHHYHQLVLAGLVGLMLGSLRVLWPWPNGTETNEMALPAGDVWLPIVLAIVGGLAVVVISLLAGEDSDISDTAEEAADTAQDNQGAVPTE